MLIAVKALSWIRKGSLQSISRVHAQHLIVAWLIICIVPLG
ncbi:MAG: hypothetical protein ACMUEL_03850 [Flavobacteriales bacterium Tduv]